MGMDVSVYQLLRALGPTEDPDALAIRTRTLALTAAQVEALRQRFPELHAEEETFLDEDKLRAAAAVPDHWTLSDWDLRNPQGWAEFSDPAGAQPSRLCEVDSAAFLCQSPLLHVSFEVEEHGYIRKPFRFASTPVQRDGDTLILSTNNFTGAPVEKIAAVLGPLALEHCIVVLGMDDIERLQTLKDLTAQPDEWQRQVLDRMGPDCVTVIDW